MPTIHVLLGWRLFFYANEGNEPVHVHCRKSDMERKYWIDENNFDIQEAYSYGISPRDKKSKYVKSYLSTSITIADQWKEFEKRR